VRNAALEGSKDYRAARLCLVVVKLRVSDGTWAVQSQAVTVKGSSKHGSLLPLSGSQSLLIQLFLLSEYHVSQHASRQAQMT
jgi:hypothetical protein